MRRWPLVISFVLFIALCASLAYWTMQFLRPPARAVAAPPPPVQAPPDLRAAANLFGGKPAATAVASNFQLKGVVMSGTPGDSVAILSADGKPAQAIRANMDIVPGVKVKEVHRRYVVISDQGMEKKVELPAESSSQVNVEAARSAPAPVSPASPAPASASAAFPPNRGASGIRSATSAVIQRTPPSSASAGGNGNAPAASGPSAAAQQPNPGQNVAPQGTVPQNGSPNAGANSSVANPSMPNAVPQNSLPQAPSPAMPSNIQAAPGVPVPAQAAPQGAQQQ